MEGGKDLPGRRPGLCKGPKFATGVVAQAVSTPECWGGIWLLPEGFGKGTLSTVGGVPTRDKTPSFPQSQVPTSPWHRQFPPWQFCLAGQAGLAGLAANGPSITADAFLLGSRAACCFWGGEWP